MSNFRNNHDDALDLSQLIRAAGDEGLAPLDVDASMARTRRSIDFALAYPRQREWWRRRISVPVPAAMAAAVAVFMLALLALNGQFQAPASAASSVADLPGGANFNVQVTVDGDHSAEFLRWLDEQEQLQTVTIQLPQTEAFQVRGDPVIRRRVPGTQDEYEIVPLKSGEDTAE